MPESTLTVDPDEHTLPLEEALYVTGKDMDLLPDAAQSTLSLDVTSDYVWGSPPRFEFILMVYSRSERRVWEGGLSTWLTTIMGKTGSMVLRSRRTWRCTY